MNSKFVFKYEFLNIRLSPSSYFLLHNWTANWDEVSEQGIAALFRKSPDQGVGRLVSQRTILLKLEFSFYCSKRRGMWLVVANFKLLGTGILCCCSCSCRSGHNVPVNLQQDKCYSLFFKFLWMKSVIHLKVKPGRQSLENGLSCNHAYFRL